MLAKFRYQSGLLVGDVDRGGPGDRWLRGEQVRLMSVCASALL
jgi:hypothetical protein